MKSKTKLLLGVAAAGAAGAAFWPASRASAQILPGQCGGSKSWCEDVTQCDEWDGSGACTHEVKATYYIDLPPH